MPTLHAWSYYGVVLFFFHMSPNNNLIHFVHINIGIIYPSIMVSLVLWECEE